MTGLAGFPGFAELKRSLRERPQLRSFGVDPDTAGTQEDWHAGSRRATSLAGRNRTCAGGREPTADSGRRRNEQFHFPDAPPGPKRRERSGISRCAPGARF